MRRALLLSVAFAALLPAAPAQAAGNAPTGVTGIALDARAELAWQPVVGASAYTVYRGTTATAVNTAVTPPSGVAFPGFTDTTAVNGVTYYYAVRSIVAGAESGNSLVVQVTPRARSCTTGNAVVTENCYPGDVWTLANPATTNGIEGFATAASINKGESVDLKVNTGGNVAFRIDIFRTGYYGNAGARLFSSIRDVQGVAQPACTGPAATTGLLECSNWSTSATITTTTSWPSGVYLLRLVRNDNGADNHLLLVVRDDGRNSDLLYGVGFTTFQAYNNYGGKSLYDYNSGGAITAAGTARAVKVSYDRPFVESRTTEPNWYTRDEHQMVSWLEQQGYDVAYASDTDLETSGSQVLNHKAYVMGAHDEYWSAAMRAALEQGRSAGVSLFATGANAVYWKIRFENGGRTQVCYKSTQSGATDPSGIPTGTWRDPAGANNPENALIGVMYVGDNDAQPFPLVVRAADGADRAWRYTALDSQAAGTSTTIGTGLVGWEWDARVANGFEPAGVTTLATSPVTGSLIQNFGQFQTNGSTSVNATRYTAASGAVVFATGTNQWDWGLAQTAAGNGQPDVRIQQATANAFSDMRVRPQTPVAALTIDDPTGTTVAAPTGVTATAGGPDSITVTWNAVAGATGYDVYRSVVPRTGGVPTGTRVNGITSITGTTFTDFGLNGGATYYYVVTAAKGSVHSPYSAEARATTTASGSGTTVRINAGGAAYTSSTGRAFTADTSVTGGSPYVTSNVITGTTDQPLYQDERWGQFSYAIPVANGTYDVRLHFVELYYGTVVSGSCVGKRVFGMDVLDTPTSPDISNLDICAQVGPRAALVKTVSNVQVNDGVLNIASVYGAADDPEVAAIEVIPATPAGPPTVTSTTPANGATGVATGMRPTATFSRAMDASTITSSSFTLTPAGGPAVSATVAYDATTSTATLTPAGALAYSTTYTARLAASIKASDGQALASAVSWSFTTAPPPAPTVTGTSPAASATNVAVGAQAKATFSRAMDPATLTTSSFTLTPSGGSPIAASISYDSSSTTATLTPAAALASNTTYTAKLDTTVKAADGTPLAAAFTWSFTTVGAPIVTSTFPANNATGVAANVSVTATFSRPMDPTTISTSSFTLTGPSGAVTATVSYNAATTTATLTPSASLANSASYTARIDTTAKASDGTPLAAAAVWSFTVVGPPTVTSTAPVAGAAAIAPNTTVKATFSRAMNAGTITASSFTLTGPGGSVAATVAYDGASTATLTPTAALATSATYTARLETTITAADGSPLAAAVSWSFTTAATAAAPPTVTSTTPANGATGAASGVQVKATFSRAMDPTSLTSSTFTVAPSGGSPVAASIAYDSATNTATLTPASPLLFSGGYTAKVDAAAKAADGVPLGTAVTWTFTVQGGTTTRINSGGGAYTSGSGAVFAADTSFTGGATYATSSAITGTSDPALYQNERWGQFSYAAAVTNGLYDVRFHFVELYYGTVVSGSCVGKRVFGMDILDTPGTDLTNVDPCGQAGGPNKALVKTVSGVKVSDGTLNIQSVYGAADDPELAAIEIVPATGPPGPPTVTARTPAPGSTGVATGTTVTATFSRGMDASTITSSSFTLSGPSGTVAASIAYNATTATATLTPAAALAASTTYTATLTTAVKAADGQALAAPSTWTFTTSAPGQPGTTTVRINAGGGAYTTTGALVFTADASFTGGSTYATSSAITGTSDPPLYQNERWGQFSYAIPVTNGTYTVTFHFVELYYGTAVSGSCVGKRIFGMDIADTPGTDITNLDICAAVGPNAALVKKVTGVQVTDGTLNISSVYGAVDDPELAAIEVTPG